MDHAAVLPPDVSERPVLVVRAPNLTEEARTSLRDYVVDSLRLGVLVVGPGVNYSLERFPQLGGVLCCGAEPAGKEEPEGPLPGQETVVAGQEELLREHAVFQPVINGRNAEEKRNILARRRHTEVRMAWAVSAGWRRRRAVPSRRTCCGTCWWERPRPTSPSGGR